MFHKFLVGVGGMGGLYNINHNDPHWYNMWAYKFQGRLILYIGLSRRHTPWLGKTSDFLLVHANNYVALKCIIVFWHSCSSEDKTKLDFFWPFTCWGPCLRAACVTNMCSIVLKLALVSSYNIISFKLWGYCAMHVSTVCRCKLWLSMTTVLTTMLWESINLGWRSHNKSPFFVLWLCL